MPYYDNELVIDIRIAGRGKKRSPPLAGGMGASIAGADGYANCYLLRFASAQSPEELELALLAFEGHPAVQSAGYNLALELELNYEPVTDLWPQSEWSETPGGSNWEHGSHPRARGLGITARPSSRCAWGYSTAAA